MQNRDGLFTFDRSKRFIGISKKVSLISGMEKHLQSLKMALNSFDETFSTLELDTSSSMKDIRLSVQELEVSIKKLQQEIQDESI